ncbi:hypothetical protein [Paenibacillus oleatilyticus]|uniref:Uncharacterized protein n=1 Tax=Paenibacillus oleatilyticus TaxID=2594886 RepID=A0ABV4VCH3_9BACL
MSEQIGSHTEEVQEQQGLSEGQYNEIMKSFGYDPKSPEEAPKEPEDIEEETEDEEEETPAIEEPKNVRVVRHNKKEVEVPEDQIDELLQKGLALDKERERKTEYEKALQRAAKLAGFDSHEDYLKSLDELEKQAKQREQEQFQELKNQLREEAENAGLDPERVDQWLESHPLMKQAREAISEREKMLQQSKEAEARATIEKQWEELFVKYPELSEAQDAEWLTPEMDAKIKRGYHPLDAYELAHKDKIREKDREKERQSIIKQQRLNKRAASLGNVAPEPDDGVPDAVKGAFAMFGLDPKTAHKFVTKK